MSLPLRHISWFYCFILVLAIPLITIGQTSTNVSNESYETLKEELDFTKTKTVVRPRFEPKPREFKKRNSSGNFNFLSGSVKLLAYLIIIGLIGLILFLVFSNIKLQENEIETEISSDFAIEDLDEIDPDVGLREALARGDFRTAIRMKFIKLLQSLVQASLINWTPEKTNRDYRREISDPVQKLTFGKLSSIYENIWFGYYPVSATDYDELAPLFDDLILND